MPTGRSSAHSRSGSPSVVPAAMCRRRACLPAWSDVASADGCCSTRIFSSPPGELRRPSRALEEARLERLRPRRGCFPASGRYSTSSRDSGRVTTFPRDSLTVRCLERQLTGDLPGVYGAVISGHRESPSVKGFGGTERPGVTGDGTTRQLPITRNEGVPGSSPSVGSKSPAQRLLLLPSE
jgi:hypothetical protein